VTPFNPEIRSIDISNNGDLLLGSRGSEIYIKSGENYKLVLQGHFEGEVWGCAVNPDPASVEFVTCGGD